MSNKKEKRGRPKIELTPEEIEAAIKVNRFLKDAAKQCGVSPPTFLREKERLGLGSTMDNNTILDPKLELEEWDDFDEFIEAMKVTDESCINKIGYDDVYITINERCIIVPWGDWHIGGAHTAHEQLATDAKFIKKHSNIYVVMMGDYCDNFLKTGHGGGVYEQAIPVNKQKQRVEFIVRMLHDRILGIVMGCFLEGTPIVADDYTLKPIETIKKVLGSDKVYNVKKHWRENYHNGDICRIKYMGNTVFDIPATYNHPFLALKKEDLKCKYRYEQNRSCKGINTSNLCKNKKCYKYINLEPKTIQAGDLNIGDFLYISKQNDPKGNKFTLNDMKIMGWYLAEGSSQKYQTTFSFGIKDLEYAKEIQKIIEEDHKDKISSTTLYTRKERNTVPLVVFGRKFSEWIQKYCGKYCDKKKIHIDVINESNEKLAQLVDSFRLGDGHTRKQGIDLCTTSKDLGFQLFNILFRIGKFASISCSNRQNKKQAYMIHYHKNTKKFFYCETENGYFTPITSIEKEHYEGTVKNLWINSSEHMYRAGGVMVKNCHDKWMFDNEGFDFAQYLAKKCKGSWMGFNALLHLTVGEQDYRLYASHKYNAWSKHNPCHGLMEAFRILENFDIAFGGHRHLPALRQMWLRKQWITCIRNSSYKTTDYFIDHKNLPKSPYYLPCILLDPDEKSIIMFRDLREAVKYL